MMTPGQRSVSGVVAEERTMRVHSIVEGHTHQYVSVIHRGMGMLVCPQCEAERDRPSGEGLW